MLNIDLHCHSNISDGVLTPALLAARANANGVDVWALTDHDEVLGIASARATAKALGMRHVAGVEVSISWAGETVHILGLQIDETNVGLTQGLAQTRSGRESRAQTIADQLAVAGIPGAFDGALKYANNPSLIARTHFARYIVERGVCANVGEVFRHYLVAGKPGYVPHCWASLSDAVAWIVGAGGIAVVAHPGRYKFSDVAASALFDQFKQLGGKAIEVVTGSHTVEQYQVYAKLANAYGFMASCGSDFHAPNESRIDVGKLPSLPNNVIPIWHDWF
jgi:predicted metal-dependent phosphoesterase TrpH